VVTNKSRLTRSHEAWCKRKAWAPAWQARLDFLAGSRLEERVPAAGRRIFCALTRSGPSAEADCLRRQVFRSASAAPDALVLEDVAEKRRVQCEMTSLLRANSAHAPQTPELSPHDRDTNCLRSRSRIAPVGKLPRHTCWSGSKRLRNEFCSPLGGALDSGAREPDFGPSFIKVQPPAGTLDPMQDIAIHPDYYPRCPTCGGADVARSHRARR
jgi:hypothetical protein